MRISKVLFAVIISIILTYGILHLADLQGGYANDLTEKEFKEILFDLEPVCYGKYSNETPWFRGDQYSLHLNILGDYNLLGTWHFYNGPIIPKRFNHLIDAKLKLCNE